jgi:hypothetical protein
MDDFPDYPWDYDPPIERIGGWHEFHRGDVRLSIEHSEDPKILGRRLMKLKFVAWHRVNIAEFGGRKIRPLTFPKRKPHG